MRVMKQEKPHNFIDRNEVIARITPLIENTAMRFNLVPLEIDFSKENHRWFLRLFLYSGDHDVTLEDCENVARSLGDFLDELIPVKYYFEVSSPGLDRKFKSDKEFIIFNNKIVDVKLKSSADDTHNKHFKARLVDFDVNKGINVIRFEDNVDLWIEKNAIHSVRLSLEDNIKIDKGDNND